MKSSIKFVLLTLAAAGLSAVMTAPTSAQVFKPRDQTCANPSTARDNRKVEERCLRGGPGKEKWQDQKATETLKDGPAFEKWMAKNAVANENANKPLVPGGPMRRDYIPANSGSGGGGGSSKGKKPR